MRNFMASIWAHALPTRVFRWAFVITFVLSLAASFWFIVVLLPRSYLGTAKIKLELAGANASEPSLPLGDSSAVELGFLKTELETIQSETVLGKVVEQLNLNKQWGSQFGLPNLRC